MSPIVNIGEMEKNIHSWDFVKDKVIFVPQQKDYGSKGIVEGTDIEMKKDLIKRPFINDIILVGVVDHPGYMMYITKETAKKWGKTDVEIEEQMGKNLLIHKTKYTTEYIDGILHIMAAGPGVLSTFLIQPKKLRDIADESGLMGKELVGVMPFRDLIMLADASMNKIIKLWTIAQNMISNKYMSYPISDKPFMIDKDGVVGHVKNDDLPGSGVMVSIDPISGRASALPIGTKDNPPEFGMPAEDLFKEALKKDKNLGKTLSAIRMMTAGISAEDFVKFLKDNGAENEEIKEVIKELTDRKILEPKKVNNDWRLIPNKRVAEMFLNKMFGKGRLDEEDEND